MNVNTLNNEWPWRQVLQWHEFAIERKFERALPTYTLMATYVNANRGRDKKAVTPLDLMPAFLVPDRIRRATVAPGGKKRFTPAFIAAFELALTLGWVSNGALAVLHTPDLRASGWNPD